MKHTKWVSMVVPSAITAVLLSGCPEPSGVVVDPAAVTLAVGGTAQLTATVDGAAGADLLVTWESDSVNIATVTAEGLVTGVADGSAVITVTTVKGNYTATCDVTVDGTAPAEVTGLTVSPKKTGIILSWVEPVDTDFAKVEITYTPGSAAVVEVSKGTATGEITGLTAVTTYEFTVKTVDSLENTSEGITVSATTLFAEGLVGEWFFDGNADDTSGKGNDGTVTGAALSADRFGTANAAFSFDGTGDYVAVADDDSLDLADAFSLVTWAYFNEVDSQQALMTKHEAGGTGTGYNLIIYLGDVYCQFGDGVSGWFYESVHAGAALSPNSWYCLAVVRSGAQIQFYIDGTLYGPISVGVNPVAANIRQLWIGGNSDSPSQHFLSGKLDDIRIYDTALSADEILAHYHEGGWDM